jgi:peptidoglycan/xylan/chitin deacetylase (PgdA/CDA1 family)
MLRDMKLCAPIVCALALLASAAPRTPLTGPPKVALTFDDLPDHGPLPPGMSRVDVAKSILGTLTSRHTPPVYGFINAKQLETRPDDSEVLRLWRETGFPLGNHTYSHMDLHTNTAEDFERDVAANESTLRKYMADRDWHWFRYPYLREGNTAEKYRTVRAMLARRGYHVAQVTLSFDDYAYNDPYARCVARNDRDGIAWLERSYRERASESLTRGRDAARAFFGHDIGHVMLLHIGAFETVMVPQLLDLLKQHGFVLTTLEDAQKDAAYTALPPETGGVWMGTLLEQMAAARQSRAAASNDVFSGLGALCR